MTTASERNEQAFAVQVAIARGHGDAMVDGNSRAVLEFFRSGCPGIIPADCVLADVKRAAGAVREEDYASAGALPGVLAIGAEIGLRDCPAVLDYIIARLKGQKVDPDAGALMLRLGLAVTAV